MADFSTEVRCTWAGLSGNANSLTEVNHNMDTQETIKRYLTMELLGDRKNLNLSVDDNLLVGGFVDSLGIMQLISFIEENFNMRVPPADVTIEHFRSIRVIAEYVESRATAPVAAQD
jgi:acyl carrier protein